MFQWPSYGNFREVTQNPHFQKKCKGETKRSFSKITQKVALVWKAQKHSATNNIILYLVCTWSARTGEDLGANSGSKSARIARLWQFFQGHPKPAFSKEVQRGDQRKFFKNRPKRSPRWKGPKALLRKWHYPVKSMHIKCKDWRRFRRKQRLQKCPNGQVMAVLARSPKPAFSEKVQRGDQRKFFKSRPKSSHRLKGQKAL